VICGVMEHIEEAGVHSGDSACCLPPFSLSKKIIKEIKQATRALASELEVIGLMNIQYAVKDGQVYLIEVNPRASRTVPFVGKATGIPWAKVATRVMLGESLKSQGVTKEVVPEHISIKEAVFPFVRFPGVDVTLGPEMKSTGEVMGIDNDFGMAFIKSQLAAGVRIPDSGNVFVSVNDHDKPHIMDITKGLVKLGFDITATSGTGRLLEENNIPSRLAHKIGEGRPNVLDIIKNGEVQLIINTPFGKETKQDETLIRSSATARGIPIITTMSGARATVKGMQARAKRGMTVKTIQEYHIETLGEKKAKKFITPPPTRRIQEKYTAS
jgi:carbamoyl-phosphate synthase large subunit